jgi:hypothetical protein
VQQCCVTVANDCVGGATVSVEYWLAGGRTPRRLPSVGGVMTVVLVRASWFVGGWGYVYVYSLGLCY